MTHQKSSDVINADAFSVEELRDMVFEGHGPLARPLALALLARKQYGEKERDFERVLSTDSETPRLRNLAALELGRLGSPEAVAILERSLGVHDELTLRGVLEGLSVTGVERVHPEIYRLAQQAGPVGETARRTETLISHRLGHTSGTSLQPAAAPPILIGIGKPERYDIDAALAALARSAPGVKVIDRGAALFRCRDQSFIFLRSESGGKRLDLARLSREKAEIGIVTARINRDGEEWEFRYYVGTEPLSEYEIRILISTPKGKVAFEGTARMEGHGAAFQIRESESNGALPLQLEGNYDGENITFTNARSGLRRRPSQSPARLVR